MSDHTSFYKTLKQTGPDSDQKLVPDQTVQSVPITPPVTYKVLSHDSPSNGSGYCDMKVAYAENSAYKFVSRKCDGLLNR